MMMMLPHTAPPTDHYRSYLVRFWQSNAEGCWRASVHCVQTSNTIRFGDVTSLLAFLQTQIKTTPTAGETDYLYRP